MSKWDNSDDSKLLDLYVGKVYSLHTDNKLEVIRQAKKSEAAYIKEQLNLSKDDIVIDLGPGLGYIANEIANDVKHLICVDISSSFLEKCKSELSDHKNVSFLKINYANLKSVQGVGITKVYATAVMIHFNIYDIYLYLQELNNCLMPGGKILFDFLEMLEFDSTDDTFKRHAVFYSKDRSRLEQVIQYNNFVAIKNIAEQLGFQVTKLREGKQPFVLLEKLR